MKFVALNTSVVVLATTHNPSILHPSFLTSQGIVPEDWQLSEEPPICTPGISVTKFANGIVFVAERNRLMIRDDAPAEPKSIGTLALRYLEKLPHVRYSAIGVNFSGYVECSAPGEWILKRFLKDIATIEEMRPSGMSLKLEFPVPDGVLNLTCEAGTVRPAQTLQERPCLLVSGNYHTFIPDQNPLAEATKAINLCPERLVHFVKVTDNVFGFDGKN